MPMATKITAPIKNMSDAGMLMPMHSLCSNLALSVRKADGLEPDYGL